MIQKWTLKQKHAHFPFVEGIINFVGFLEFLEAVVSAALS